MDQLLLATTHLTVVASIEMSGPMLLLKRECSQLDNPTTVTANALFFMCRSFPAHEEFLF